uniref:Sperm acrosome associated 6 n=1 Tax=Ursus maritimus TaxID=29073 RepID=A0A452U018_URSMA
LKVSYPRSHLHDAFTQMTHSLQEIAAVAFPDAAEKMRKVITQLKEAQEQRFRPTGLQEVARRFHCRGCYSTVCDLPLDCPGERRGLQGEGTGRTGGTRAEQRRDRARRGRARAV